MVDVQIRLKLRYGLLCISKGSVINFGKGTDWPKEKVTIVNAANTGGVFGGAVDRAVNDAGGEALVNDRKKLPEISRGVRINYGSAVLTGPNSYGKLYGKYVVHAVGPDYPVLMGRGNNSGPCDKLLKNAYAEALGLAAKSAVSYVGFALLSAGVFRGTCSLEHVLGLGMEAIFESAYEGLEEVHLVAYTDAEMEALKGLAKKHPELLVKSEGAGAEAPASPEKPKEKAEGEGVAPPSEPKQSEEGAAAAPEAAPGGDGGSGAEGPPTGDAPAEGQKAAEGAAS
uniref:Macro domain-containing protein n=1 Tax=Chromera velia CCMP2878 TaxID=1169474 RepID=A0A0G4G432_9ALVE|eukprot:Cvel_4148.t1-p1 / transcript=Cvel_4148.t1 / gene=Cvel_4148 / organism=Chromera_velia_CCMP2878 / gene_product=Macro domain-containing protein TTE0995, putative / transcript_product=Macro domain-containing protein TTE0995, putative / location=Cvel_scaffold178:14093-14941(-) / protein_length=283 / sequence_SO=supercontig / SO=protein_coding / is_pseudo=false